MSRAVTNISRCPVYAVSRQWIEWKFFWFHFLFVSYMKVARGHAHSSHGKFPAPTPWWQPWWGHMFFSCKFVTSHCNIALKNKVWVVFFIDFLLNIVNQTTHPSLCQMYYYSQLSPMWQLLTVITCQHPRSVLNFCVTQVMIVLWSYVIKPGGFLLETNLRVFETVFTWETKGLLQSGCL